MIAGRNRRYRLWPLMAILSVAAAFLASGCLWGVVRDADTGDPIAGVTVSYVDSQGQKNSTTTDANGRYVFDQASGPVPAAGPISFSLSEATYEPLTAARLIEYNDNPNASVADLSSFWEVQSFNLVSQGTQMVDVQLEGIDLRKALLASPGGTTAYRVVFRVYGWGDPTTPACERSSVWFPISSLDPPLQGLSYSCLVPGDTFRATVTVILKRTGGTNPGTDTSTGEWPWVAPGPGWMNVLLDSTDAAGADDPDLEFEAHARAQEVTIVPLGP